MYNEVLRGYPKENSVANCLSHLFLSDQHSKHCGVCSQRAGVLVAGADRAKLRSTQSHLPAVSPLGVGVCRFGRPATDCAAR